jgi:hypothetical protein
MVGRENAAGHRRPIDGTVGLEYLRPPTLPQRLLNYRVIRKQTVASTVGIEEPCAKLDEHFRHKRFAACHAAD